MGWSNLKSAASRASGNGGRYLKLSDGDRYELLFMCPPHQKEVTWPDGRTSVRFAARVYATSDPAGVQQLEFGPGVARDLADELAGQDPGTTKVMIRRTGSGKTDTRYTVARMGQASADEIKAAQEADEDRTWDLTEDGWWELEGSSEPAPKAAPAAANAPRSSDIPEQDEDIPF